MTATIQVLSDLHAEIDPMRARMDVADLGADLVLLAGDIDQGGAGVRWVAETWADTPVVYVAGNHEAYGGSIDGALAQAREAAVDTGVHVLEREAITLDGVRVLGATLWTDFELAGPDEANRARAWAGQTMPDYRVVAAPDGRMLRPADTIPVHAETIHWLEYELATATGPVVVVSHHAPSPQSLGAGWERDLLSPAYASDLDWLIERYRPALWVHGHTHRAVDYRLGETRVVSNPRGYYGQATGWDARRRLTL